MYGRLFCAAAAPPLLLPPDGAPAAPAAPPPIAPPIIPPPTAPPPPTMGGRCGPGSGLGPGPGPGLGPGLGMPITGPPRRGGRRRHHGAGPIGRIIIGPPKPRPKPKAIASCGPPAMKTVASTQHSCAKTSRGAFLVAFFIAFLGMVKPPNWRRETSRGAVEELCLDHCVAAMKPTTLSLCSLATIRESSSAASLVGATRTW